MTGQGALLGVLAGAVSASTLVVACSRDARPPAESRLPPMTSAAVINPAEPQAASPSSAPVVAVAAVDGGGGEPDQVPDIEFVPTPQNVVDKMLDVAKLTNGDVLYDLGCGDGRIVVTAAKKFGIRAVGFDVDSKRIEESRENAKNAGVESLVRFEKRDVFTVDLSPASVVTLYLLPELNVRLIPQLEKLRPGARIVSHDFDMEGVQWEKWWTVMAKDHRTPKDREHYVYLWKTPLKKH
jgi:SAM-dependent methyltransferase